MLRASGNHPGHTGGGRGDSIYRVSELFAPRRRAATTPGLGPQRCDPAAVWRSAGVCGHRGTAVIPAFARRRLVTCAAAVFHSLSHDLLRWEDSLIIAVYAAVWPISRGNSGWQPWRRPTRRRTAEQGESPRLQPWEDVASLTSSHGFTVVGKQLFTAGKISLLNAKA